MYRVTEYLGDYPMECQLHWNADFKHAIVAYGVAKDIWEESVKTTKVLDPDYYVLIEREDATDPSGYYPIGAFNISSYAPNDYIPARHVKAFVRRFGM